MRIAPTASLFCILLATPIQDVLAQAVSAPTDTAAFVVGYVEARASAAGNARAALAALPTAPAELLAQLAHLDGRVQSTGHGLQDCCFLCTNHLMLLRRTA